MAFALMQKDGETDIYVDSAAVQTHVLTGWHVAAIAYTSAQRLLIPDGCELDFVLGLLKLDGVPILATAAEINSLAAPVVDGLTPLASRLYMLAPVVGSPAAVHAAIQLGATAQDITTAITNPDFARTLTIKGNVSGIAGNVVLTISNVDGEEITDTIALNGTSEVDGVKAGLTVTNIHVPAQTHTPTAQVETATAAGTITGSGNATVLVTAAGMTGSPITISVAVLNNDTAAQWAAKVRAALIANANVSAFFDVSGATTAVILTRKTPAANDATLNISLDNDTCTGITTAATSANTTAGVAYDTVSIGVGNKFGMPQIIYNTAFLQIKLFDGSSDAGSLTVDPDEVEKNLYTIAGTPDGSKILDLVYLA